MRHSDMKLDLKRAVEQLKEQEKGGGGQWRFGEGVY